MLQVSLFIEDEIAVDWVVSTTRRREALFLRLEFIQRSGSVFGAFGSLVDVDGLKGLWEQVKRRLPRPPEPLNVALSDPTVAALAMYIAGRLQSAIDFPEADQPALDVRVLRVEVRSANRAFGAVVEVR